MAKKALTTWGPHLAATIPALAVAILGATVLAGWILGKPGLLLAPAGSPLMAAATAAGFVLAGMTLIAAVGEGRSWYRVRMAGGLALVTLGLLVLVGEHVLGMDFGLHTEPVDPGAAPGDSEARGQMAPPTALAFVLTGILAMFFDVPGDRLRALVVQALAGALLSLGMVSLIGYDIDPSALFASYRFSWMAVSSATAFIAIGVALLALIASSRWYHAVYEQREDEKILILTMGILVLVSLAMGTAGFSMMLRNLESAVRLSLAQSVEDRALVLDNVIEKRVNLAKFIANRPALVERMLLRTAGPSLALDRWFAAEGESFLDAGFSGIAFELASGERVVESGMLQGPALLEAKLPGTEHQSASLRWNQGFFIRTRVPIVLAIDVVGHVIADQPMALLDQLQFDTHQLGKTAEWVLCAPEPGRMACFPQHSSPRPHYVAQRADHVLVPTEHALQGKSGVVVSDDYRGIRVIAGYAPVGQTGLGVVLKIDAVDYYAPVRVQLRELWRWLLALALVGALLVSSQVRPIAQRLIRSERLALDRAAELARREQSLRGLYAALGDGIVVFTADGHIEFMNPAAERLFGFSEGELIGRTVATLMPEHMREANARATAHFLESGESDVLGKRNLVFPAMRKDGTTMDIEFSLAQMGQESDTRIVAVVRDVTEREELARMKSEFIANVSHELRTPLTAIMGSLELLRDEDMGIVDGPGRTFLDMAWRNSERLAILVNDVIDFERIESGALAFRDSDFPLAPFLEESVELNQPYAAREKVTLRVVEPVPPIQLHADRDRLMQVMANLLSNASKFSPSGATVEVSAARVDAGVRIAVTDHGDGIPEEFLPRIFQKFAQADSSDTREQGGTGLGLSICKAIVERMGGRIGFDTARGKGTTFWFELPTR